MVEESLYPAEDVLKVIDNVPDYRTFLTADELRASS